MRVEQVMALQLQETLGQLPLVCSQNLGSQRADVVICDPNGHTNEKLECSAVCVSVDLR